MGPGRKPRRPVFSERGSFLSKTNRSKLHRSVNFTWPFTESEQAELILILANSYLGETHNRHLFLSRRFQVKIAIISLAQQLQLIWVKYKLLEASLGRKIANSRKHPNLSLVVRKPVFGVSDKVRHKPGCAVTEDG